ncbi:MAG: M48 family metallopeptidase [Bacilli bacterium]|nr:M48 family metallopeptidase [Bacilli bacterium]
MIITINDIEYSVVIIKKNNKNTYIRLKENNVIQVTTSYLTSKKAVLNLIYQNETYIKKMQEKINKNNKKENDFYYLGNKYDIVVIDGLKDIDRVDNKIYTPSIEILNKYITKELKKIYLERLDYWYNNFEENIPYPKLKVRKMKTRWGVCNRKNITVTLNSELIRYNIRCLDYVIVHELSHYIHFNHSAAFWQLVSKYCPNYKVIRKELRD